MVTIDGEGVDCTGHAEDETEDYALMTFNSSNSGSDTEVTSFLKVCEESYAKLKKLYDEQREQLGVASIEIQAYTLALKKVEAQLVCHHKNQLAYEEKIRFMKIDLDDKTNVLIYHKKLLAAAETEKEELKTKLENFQSSSKGLSKLLNSQMSAKEKSRLGFVKFEGIHVVPPPMTGNYMPPKSNFRTDELKFTYGPKQSTTSESDAKTSDLDSCESSSSEETLETMPKPVESKPKVVNEPKVWSDTPIIAEYESDSDDEYVSKALVEQEKPSYAFINTVKHDNPHQTLKGKDIVDSGCFRHMIGNKDYLVNYQDFNGGPVAFGCSKSCLIAKATIDESTKWHRRMTIPLLLVTKESNTMHPAEAVSTACYVLNRVLVTKPQNKTAYEHLTGKIPIISYIRPFGCHVAILNTIDHLGKFAKKYDEGFLVRYSLSSKAFRVYNLETKRVEENLHINFLENKPNVAGKGPTWLFDLDYLTDSINYQPITAKNKANKTVGPMETNNSAGTQDGFDAGNSDMEANHAQEYYLLPLLSSYTLTVKSSKIKNGDQKLNGVSGHPKDFSSSSCEEDL
uniref:Retrovirus-related Pol polyprotein from transposon TNT 1-94 n=1 Tax=Tanacetum cinerariifolium TaxID=118510 RepID=A0A6L2N0Q2_TANCI|nr:retrovirus-related Pol polyprotein from transposon TNT 1-94 [Tanacetum cinerariifolium]